SDCESLILKSNPRGCRDYNLHRFPYLYPSNGTPRCRVRTSTRREPVRACIGTLSLSCQCLGFGGGSCCCDHLVPVFFRESEVCWRERTKLPRSAPDQETDVFQCTLAKPNLSPSTARCY